MLTKLRMLLVLKLWPKGDWSATANRIEQTVAINHIEYKLVKRNTKEKDAYSREELYVMLRWIRRMENRTKGEWKCPEPDYHEVALSSEWNRPQRLGDKK